MATLEEVIKSIIECDFYWDTTTDTDTAARYMVSDYEDSLSTTLYTLKSLPLDTSITIQTIEKIFLVLDGQHDKVIDGVSNHINLLKLEKIL